MKRKLTRLLALAIVLGVFSVAFAQPHTAVLTLLFRKDLGPMEIDRISLGQGGLSPDPMWDSRVAEIRALHPRLIRLFVQEYFDLLPERGHYQFDKLDPSVDEIVRTGARPLMNICFKPKVLFPVVDQDIVEPKDYRAWDELIFHLVNHYKERGLTGIYWEVGNEPDIGERGGTPYRFQPESYVHYYQHTVTAILRADPEAHVGGPALANWRSPILPALIAFCARNKVPLDFVSWHNYDSHPAEIEATIRSVQSLLAAYPSLHPETVLDEWNMSLTTPPRDRRIQPAFIVETAWRMKEAGLSFSCYYHIRDYHVDRAVFAPFFSPAGASGMALWWNRMPQYDGLFDYQNVIRPSYFAFELLSRLTGDRLAAVSNDESVHALMTYDKSYGVYSLLFWNFSAEPIVVKVEPHDLTTRLTGKRRMLDADAPSNDENIRLRPLNDVKLGPESPPTEIRLGPYGIQFWSLEKNSHSRDSARLRSAPDDPRF